MKILFLCLYDPLLFGGINYHLRNLSEELVKKGVEVHILISGFETIEKEVNGVKLHYVRNKFKGSAGEGLYFNLFTVATTHQLIKKYKIDIVHGQSPSSYGYALFKKSNIPFVVTLHGTSFKEISSFTDMSLKTLNFGVLKEALILQPLMAALTNIEYHCADSVIAVSQGVANEAVAYNRLPKEKIIAIHNGINLQSHGYSIKTQENYTLLVVSRLSWRKGIQYLIYAMPKIMIQYPQTNLIIVGSGDQEKSLKASVKSLGLFSSVRFLKNLPKEKLFSLYKEASIYVHPSLYEPLSISVFEAMSLGKCIITTNVGGNPELIENNFDGRIIEAANSEQIAGAVIELLGNSELRKFFGQNAIKKAKKEFNWSLIAEKTLRLYKKLINNKF